MELNEYLTKDEREQMESLMKKAAERRKKDNGEADEEVSVLYFQYQYGSRKQTDEKKADYETDLENVMEQVCNFCQKYKLCDSRKKCREYDEDDEELPF